MIRLALFQSLICFKLANNSTWYPVNSCRAARPGNLSAKIWKETQCSFCHSVQFGCSPVSCQSTIMLYISGNSGRFPIVREDFYVLECGRDLWWVVINVDKWKLAVRLDAWQLVHKDDKVVEFHLWRSFDYGEFAAVI